MKKKYVSLLIISMLATNILTGCGSSSSSSSTTGSTTESTSVVENSNLNEPGTYPVVNEKETYTIFVTLQSNVEDMETNAFTLLLEEETNIHIEWRQVPTGSATEALNLILAGGEYPDAFLFPSLSREQIYNYGAMGAFLPLNDLIENNAPNYQAVLDETPELVLGSTAPDGNIYFLSNGAGTYHMSSPFKLWLNQEYLTNLGAEVPTTTEEFKELMIRIRNEDANGNGNSSDEIPLIASQGLDVYNLLSFFSGSFIPYDGTDLYDVIDGDVDFIADNEEWKELLRYMKELYDEKLFDIECLTQDVTSMKAIMSSSEDSIIGAFTGHTASGTIENYEDFYPISPLKGPSGMQEAVNNDYSYNVGLIISSACESPEALMQWADWTYQSQDTVITAKWGPFGEGWDYADEGGLDLNGETAYYKTLYSFADTANYGWQNSSLGWNIKPGAQIMLESEPDVFSNEYLLQTTTTELYAPFLSDKNYPTMIFSEEDYSMAIAELNTTIKTYVESYVIKFISGEADLDADWEAYVAAFESMGAYEVEAMMDETYKKSAYAK